MAATIFSNISPEVNVTTSPLPPRDPESQQLISREFRDMFEYVIELIMFFINSFGVLANAVNIRVFLRQGVASDTTTIGLFSLAISDFMGCIFMLPPSTCFFFRDLDFVDFRNCTGYTAMTCHYAHIIFSRITCWLTVYISIERTLCVLFPLKVKFLLRPKLTKRVVITIYVFWIIFHLPYATNTYMVPEFSPVYNASIVQIKETSIAQTFLYINLLLATTILTTIAMIVVAINTAILLNKLKSASKWRREVTSAASLSSSSAHPPVTSSKRSGFKPVSSKEKEVVSTVTSITAIYLAGSHIPAIATVSVPGLSLSGSNSHLFYTLYYCKYFMDSLSSSVNIFFYLRLSSRYKAAFFHIYFPNSLELQGMDAK
ncbi:probable G-protein coupled receptor B0563.6 [Aplysia californica]|uniref:Probable G-protein coupled receptor B0563.6 n=1 Tax=Aplysia californica TaxID=6500 RepID=A0ABM0JRG3_APLCA|nr:probable G-protein coupled receptor B0563.6 [Aplysia californica]